MPIASVKANMRSLSNSNCTTATAGRDMSEFDDEYSQKFDDDCEVKPQDIEKIKSAWKEQQLCCNSMACENEETAKDAMMIRKNEEISFEEKKENDECHIDNTKEIQGRSLPLVKSQMRYSSHCGTCKQESEGARGVYEGSSHLLLDLETLEKFTGTAVSNLDIAKNKGDSSPLTSAENFPPQTINAYDISLKTETASELSNATPFSPHLLKGRAAICMN